MQTPPGNGPSRPNFMQFRRGDEVVDSSLDSTYKNDMMMKFAPKYQFPKKQTMPTVPQRENISKIVGQMRKHLNFLQSTKWMFENNKMLPIDNFSPNPL